MTSGTETNWIELENVTFVRSGRTILDNVNWKVKPGEHWTVFGSNGSGKTTLLRLLAGYLWPTRGTITVLGERFGHVDLRELRKRIGWVGSFLEAQIPPNQKPLDLVVSGKFASIGIFEKPEAEDYERAHALVRELECEAILESPYGVLSQGEKQRLLIARALMPEPRLLILDESCAGLDLLAREQLLGTLQRLGMKEDAPNMVFVTHHLEEIIPVFERALLLKKGKVLAMGRREEVLDSEVLSGAFGTRIEVSRNGERYSARAVFG